MKTSKRILREHKRAITHQAGYRDVTKHLKTIEYAVGELKNEAARHEHRGLVARQGARDLIEEGRKKEAKLLIEQMLSERNYFVACCVTSRRIKRLMDEIRFMAGTTGGLTKKVICAISLVECTIRGSILADIEEALNRLEYALDPRIEHASSVIRLVANVKPDDVDQLETELENEISVLSNLSQGKGIPSRNIKCHKNRNPRKYKMEKDVKETLEIQVHQKREKTVDDSSQDCGDFESEIMTQNDEESQPEKSHYTLCKSADSSSVD